MSETFATTGGRRKAALERLFQLAGVEGRAGGLKRARHVMRPFIVHRRECDEDFRRKIFQCARDRLADRAETRMTCED